VPELALLVPAYEQATPKVQTHDKLNEKITIHFESRKKVCQVGQVGRIDVFPEKNEGRQLKSTWQGLPS